MRVVFHHPPTNSQNPFNDFDPSNIDHYPNCSGIYIYGLKLVVDGVKKFVPMYVGISDNLQKRLCQHYKEERSGGKSKKELFDFSKSSYSLKEIRDRYNDMLIYDVATNRRNRIQQPLVFNLPYLVYFQSSCIYNYKFSLPAIGDVNHVEGIQHLRIFSQNKAAQICANNIEKTKVQFDNDFYFVYSCLHNDDHVVVDGGLNEAFKNFKVIGAGQSLAERIELSTKLALNTIGIHTTAIAKSKHYQPMTLDFSKIQSQLVNMGSHPFNDNTGNYVNPLTIQIK